MSDGTTTWTYTYDANGMRTSRTDGTTTYSYVYNGSKLTQMTVGNNTLYFTYGVDGSPLAVTFNNVVYFYVTNLQGDVIGIQNTAGVMAAVYYYDAWGNILGIDGMMADTLGILNPLTYRGYVYDHDTGLYYLQSRYYNPEWGRFLNADGLVSTGQGLLGANMLAYCGNNPMMKTDPTGAFGILLPLVSYHTDKILKILARYPIERQVDNIIDACAVTEDVYLGEVQMHRNATIVYNYLSKEGWSHNAICAVLGNMQQESTINPGLHQRGGGGYGIVQWDPATKYTNWADMNGYAYDSIVGQLKFLIYSMQPGVWEWFENPKISGYYLSASDFICSCDSIEYLTAVFLYSYERAGNPRLDLRIQYALYWSDYFS